MARRTPGIYSTRLSGAGTYSPSLNGGGNYSARLLYVASAAVATIPSDHDVVMVAVVVNPTVRFW